MKHVLFLFLGFLVWLGLCSGAAATELRDLRMAEYQTDVVRLVVESDEKPDYKLFYLQHPKRLVIDFDHAVWTQNAKNNVPVPTAFVSETRLGTPVQNTARLVLSLPESTVTHGDFLIPADKGENWRFVIDLSQQNVKQVPVVEQSPSPVAQKSLSAPVIQTDGKIDRTPRKKIIMLDPGHGGRDPGAISRKGRFEKNLTLNMAKELKPYLEKAGYVVKMTRTRDVAVSLRGRIEKAHNANADLFISIHADSAINSSAKGLSVYTISERASDREAAALAERENKADIILGMDLGNYQPEVTNILIDLAKRDTMDKSSQYANFLVEEMRKKVKLVPNAHRFAGFVVLKSPNIPSVLLEMGYLSNREEEKLLHQASYRKKLAIAMTNAVNKYFDAISE